MILDHSFFLYLDLYGQLKNCHTKSTQSPQEFKRVTKGLTRPLNLKTYWLLNLEVALKIKELGRFCIKSFEDFLVEYNIKLDLI